MTPARIRPREARIGDMSTSGITPCKPPPLGITRTESTPHELTPLNTTLLGSTRPGMTSDVGPPPNGPLCPPTSPSRRTTNPGRRVTRRRRNKGADTLIQGIIPTRRRRRPGPIRGRCVIEAFTLMIVVTPVVEEREYSFTASARGDDCHPIRKRQRARI